MPKLMCLCGFIHDLSPNPDSGFLVVKDTDYEDLLKAEETRNKTKELNELIEHDTIVFKLIERMYECPECGRLLWRKIGEDVYTIYEKCSNKDV